MNTNPLPMTYDIRVCGRLDERWACWFEGLNIRPGGDDETILTGMVIDQAALHGILNRIRDLGLELISVQRCMPLDIQKSGKISDEQQ